MALDWVSSIIQIVLVNAVVSGDNAMVIALAAHRLPAAQRRQAMLWGSGLAIVMRLLLTFVVSTLLLVPEVAREAMALAWQEPVGMHSLMCLDQRYSPYPLFPRPSTSPFSLSSWLRRATRVALPDWTTMSSRPSVAIRPPSSEMMIEF